MLKVAVLSLASACEEKYLHNMGECLSKRFGIEVVSTFQEDGAQEKARRLIEVCMDPNTDCIWALRGGYGSAECLPYLKKAYDQLKDMPNKIIMGHSDITALLLYFSQQLHQKVVHGPVVRDVLAEKVGEATCCKLLRFFQTGSLAGCYELMPMNDHARVPATITAQINGGNGCLVNLSVGDCNEVDTKNKILVLEDVNEPPDAVIRGLSYLSRIGKIELSNAIVLGDFLYQAISKELMDKRLAEFVKSLARPVFRMKHFGHGRENYPLPFYGEHELVAGGDDRSSFLKISS